MAFSHINLDAPGTPPGRNDPCPCGSGKKTKRCCGVDRSRFLPLRGRHRGVVPVDSGGACRSDGRRLHRPVSRQDVPAGASRRPLPRRPDRRGARRAARAVQRPGRAARPGARDPRAGRLRPTARPTASYRTRVRAAARRASRRACRQAPASAWRSGCRPRRTRTAAGPTTAQDIYGPVSCSQTLRSGHLGILAAAGGLWHSRNPAASPYAETTAGELAQLITGRRRLGGKDIAEIHRLLAQLEQLQLSATVNRAEGRQQAEPGTRDPQPTGRARRAASPGRTVG